MKKIKVYSWAYQFFDWDYWLMSSLDGKITSYTRPVTKAFIKGRGYKIGKKLKEQKYSDMTAYLLTAD